MKIGILETGRPPQELGARYGDYPAMFKRLLGAVARDLEFAVYHVVDEELPGRVDECDAWLVTGSRHGVYDPLPWIEPLKRFLREAYARDIPIVGICFGHQILAEALGGKAEKSARGWGLGVHRYRLVQPEGWVRGVDRELSLNAFHQDQVTELPPDAEVLAASDFCPYAALAYRGKAISVQAHPEFSREFERDLLQYRRGDSFSQEQADAALETLDEPLHTPQIAEWIVRFLDNETRTERRAS